MIKSNKDEYLLDRDGNKVIMKSKFDHCVRYFYKVSGFVWDKEFHSIYKSYSFNTADHILEAECERLNQQ